MRQTLVKGLFNMPAPPLPSGRRHECFGLKIKASSTHRHGLRVQTFSHWTVLIIRIKSLLEMCRRKNRRVWALSVFYNSSESKAAKRWTARRMWTRPHITLDCDFSLFICIFLCVWGREMGSNFSNRCCNINKKKTEMIVSHLVYLWFYINNGGDTQFRLSQEKHQETSILLTSIYNKTYIKIIFSAKQLRYITSTLK